jgi:hypothetical protein
MINVKGEGEGVGVRVRVSTLVLRCNTSHNINQNKFVYKILFEKIQRHD